jgi:hypothetical protein
MRLLAFLYEWSLRVLPRDFRARYGEEMLVTYRERELEAASWRGAVAEIADVLMTAGRLHAPRPAAQLLAGAAVTCTVMLLVYQLTEQRIDFRAVDPAGEFTLTISRGKPIAASMNGEPVPLSRLQQSGDSIRFLHADGSVLLTLAHEPGSSSIAWQARRERE